MVDKLKCSAVKKQTDLVSFDIDRSNSICVTVPVGGDHEDGNETDEEAIEEKRERKKEKTEEPSGDNLT